MMIPLSTTFDNAVWQSAKNFTSDSRAKMQGFIKKLKKIENILSLSVHTEILGPVGKLALMFEKKNC